jgi:ABC-type multidrug transport system ATPase subunit/ABC-type multidrug transport system permease subunit
MKETTSGDELASLVDEAPNEINLNWDQISFSVEENKERKTILHQMSGSAKSGEMLAILGATGSGKSTLLNVLAGRMPVTKTAELNGTITVNGRTRDQGTFRRISAYVLQDDLLYPHLTVQETLYLASQFFLPTETSDEKKEAVVESILRDLGLLSCRNTTIGDEKIRGVSGGERKRTSIAVQLISNPQVFFLDEPTSGLDSFQAQSVMQAMSKLAKTGKLVIAVIHQPRSSIFDMFDRLLLLSEGRTMYSGVASECVEYFEKQGHTCPDLFNPSDFFLDILSPDTRTASSRHVSSSRIERLGEAWQRKVALENSNMSSNGEKKGGAGPMILAPPPEWSTKKLVRNFRLLCWRAIMEQTREIPTIVIRMTITVVFSLIIAGMYSSVGYSQTAIGNRTGLLFVMVINQGFNALMAVLNVFPKEKLIVSRERSAYAYDTLSYFAAKYICELPLNVLPATIFGTIIYWIVGLNDAPGRFGVFVGVLMLEAATSVALGLTVSACAPSVEAATNFGPLTLIVSLLFGGFFINLNSLPAVAEWLPNLSFLRWTFGALAVNEFADASFTCEYPDPTMCETSGDQVLDRLNFDGTVGDQLFGLSMMFLGFLLLALYTLDRNGYQYMEIAPPLAVSSSAK